MEANDDWGIDPVICVERLSEGVTLPVRATSGSACMDICAHLKSGQNVKYFDYTDLNPKEESPKDGYLCLRRGYRYMIPTGLKLKIPYQHVVKIYPRSGLSLKKGICLANGVGVIDSDYRDELMILLINHGPENFISDGERIAQLELQKVEAFLLKEVSSIEESASRSGGFGSTGSK